MKQVIGVDIGGTKCSVTLGCARDSDITVIDKLRFPTEASKGVRFTLNRIMENMDAIIGRNGKKPADIAAVGISCGGPLDSTKGLILSPPNLIGWDRVPIVEMMECRFGIPTRLQNDANACALAEWKFGAGKGSRNMVFLTFGTGLGAGLILDGRLYSGTNDMAGEAGHLRLSDHGPVGYGKAGSFEGFCSGGGITQLARIKVTEKLQMGENVAFCNNAEQLELLDAKIVGDAARNGDTLAKEIYAISGTYLGKGLSILVDLLNPEVIVIGSIFARDTGLLWPYALAVMEQECLSHARNVCRVVPAGLGEGIGDIAALAVAVYEG